MYKKDMMGQRFGRLTVLEELPERNRKRVVWRCQCECGNMIDVIGVYLRNGDTTSCGCLKKEREIVNLREQYEAKRVDGVNTALLKAKVRVDNKSGVKGVSVHGATGKWDATIRFQGKQLHLGRFANIEDAIAARKQAEELYHRPYLEG